MKKTFFCFVFGILLPAFSPTLAGDRALIIGVEKYQSVPGTPGCVADAKAMSEFVQKRFGFSAASVKVMLNEDGTAKAIEQEFQNWLIQGTNPGDRVFFFYAGHGSQVPDDNGDEEDHWDETIAPYDAQYDGTNQIRDDLFESFIKQLAGRRCVFVFDSCHSGTISRGIPKLSKYPQGGGARYLPRRDQVPEKGRGLEGYTVSSLPRTRDLVVENGFLDKPELSRLSGVVIISAAQSDQTAFPLSFTDGSMRGALSFAFEQVQPGDRLPLVSQLKMELAERISAFQKEGKLDGAQSPVIEICGPTALNDRPLFGTGSATVSSNSTVPSPVLPNPLNLTNPASTEKVTIQTKNRKTSYRNGELISYEIYSSLKGYLYLIAFSEQDVATVLLPNSSEPTNEIEAGATITIPSARAEPIVVQEPFGTDTVVAVVSTQKISFGDKASYRWDEIFDRLKLKEIQEELQRGQARKAIWQSGAVLVKTVP